MAAFADTGGFRSSPKRPILIAPAARHIETLQREAGRVDLRMAGFADGLAAVFRQLLADRGRAARIGFHCRNTRRRRGTGWPRMRSVIQTPRSTGEVVVPLAVTFKTLACVEQASARRIRRQSDAADRCAGHAGNAVERSQAFIEHGEIGGRRYCAPADSCEAIR